MQASNPDECGTISDDRLEETQVNGCVVHATFLPAVMSAACVWLAVMYER